MLGVVGCASIPADQNMLSKQDIARVQLAMGIKLARDGWPDTQWWTQYRDPQLNMLIAQALTNSPTLEIAAARIDSARAVMEVSRADQGLNANIYAATHRQRYSASGLASNPLGGNYFNESTLQVQVRSELDWWGKHQPQIAAALGEVNARIAGYAQAKQSLATAITQSYFNLQSGWARLENLRRSLATQSDIVAERNKRITYGVAAISELRAAETELKTWERQIAQLDSYLIRERETLRALLGADSDALADLTQQGIPDVPHALPSKLGMELLARRPDLQAARWRVEASLSRVEAAQAAFYPDINLTGSLGLDALSLSKLFNMASRTLFIGPALSLPLFDSNRLEARLGAARSERNEMIANYNQTVFNVIRDVAQQGATLQGIESQIRQQSGATQASNDLLRAEQAKFNQGLADRGAVLAATLVLLKQQDASLQLNNQQLLAEVSLINALGGGYRTNSISTGAALGQSAK